MLYEKYRPVKFKDIIGQGANSEILKNQIKFNKIAHSYLLCGNHGTGKTSTARILAKAINCENPVEGEPCGKCASCISLEKGNNPDVIEVDAASNNGVDSVRDIISNMNYKPMSSKYKIYIIDEVHMFSKSAFNALLKTLEEPPKHGIFILCTTEESAIPVTVLSRCQRYNYKRINQEAIATRLNLIADNEGYKPKDQAKILNLIAKMSDGAVRDAISLLEQLINGNQSDYNEIVKLLGIISNDKIFKLLGLMYQKDSSKAIELIYSVLEEGIDIERFIINTIDSIRAISIIKAGASENLIKMTDDDLSRIKKAADVFTSESLFMMIDILQKTYSEIKISNFKGVLIEMAILKICKNFEVEECTTVAESIIDNSTQINKAELEATIRLELEEKIREEVIAEMQDQLKEAVEKIKEIAKEEAILEYKKSEKKRLEKEENNNKNLKIDERNNLNEFKTLLDSCKRRFISACENKGNTNSMFLKIAEIFKKSQLIRQEGTNKILICTDSESAKNLTKVFSNEKLKNGFETYFIINKENFELEVQ